MLALLLLSSALVGCDRERVEGASLAATPGAESQSGADALAASVAAMGQSLGSRLDGRTVAVFEFADLKGDVSELGTLVSEQLTTDLVRGAAGNARVLERRQVLQVLEELNLRKSDLTTSEVELAAQQLGANVVVVGSASAVGRRIEVNARAVDVAGGTLLTADRFSIGADEGLLRLASQRMASGNRGSGTGGATGVSIEPEAPVTEASVGPVSARVTECRAAGSEVTCSLVIVSATVDANAEVSRWGGESEARDEGGNAYAFSSFTFGSENGADWSTLLVAREPTPARLTLTGVPITMNRLTRISAGVSIQIGERYIQGQSLVFRNVPIIRDER